MASVADLVDERKLRSLADAGVFATGTSWADAGAVRFDSFGPGHVAAIVDEDGEAYRVELRADGDALSWDCECTDALEMCPHVVAAAVEAGRRPKA